MFNNELLNFSEQDRKLHYAISDSYVPGFDLLLGMNDSLEFLKSIPPSSVKLIVASPPYNVGKAYENRIGMDEYLTYQEKIAKECVRILRDDGNIAWEVGNYVSHKEIYPLDFFYYQIFKELNKMKMRNRIIWRVEHGLHASLRFSGRYETISWFTKTDNYTFNLDPVRIPQKYPGKRHHRGEKYGMPSCNPLGKNPGDVWDIVLHDWEEQIWNIPNVKAYHPERTNHPAQFPIELVQRLILALTNEEDTILDPYGGVGSSALAAIILNRKAISVDREPEYITTTVERFRYLAEGSLKVRNIGTKIYQPNGREKVCKVPEEFLTLSALQ